MKHGAHIAKRAIGFGSHHQDHQQRGQRHLPIHQTIGAQRQRRRDADGDARIGYAARDLVGRQHPHGATQQLTRLDRKKGGPRLGLPERLERAQSLHRIEKLGREALEGD